MRHPLTSVDACSLRYSAGLRPPSALGYRTPHEFTVSYAAALNPQRLAS